ncbi:regulator of microtubule dynamics protein 1-like [Diabrotica undecimpunctata]|uniref:regulator of microtubule dynamics protein 1-like n=1 Tax=Diabrotica undecimpunctata TaxID=50387 RepID=UPI003B63A4BE
MSKLKVSLYHIVKAFFVSSKPRRQLYVFAFTKSLKHLSWFRKEYPDDTKLKKYFNLLTIPEVLAQADELHDEEKFLDVYELLDRIRFINDPEVLWRIARALYNLNLGKDLNKQIRFIMMDEALFVLETALGNGGSQNAEVHKWMAIILDTHYGLINLENRVKYASMVRNHLEKACELNPDDFTSYYMMGNWCYQMCRLTKFQRFIAKYFLATEPPVSEYEVAYKYLQRAEELRPRTVLANLYLLGDTCKQIGQYFKAKYYLNLAVNLKSNNENDKHIALQAKNLLKKLQRYELGRNVLFYDPLSFNDQI